MKIFGVHLGKDLALEVHKEWMLIMDGPGECHTEIDSAGFAGCSKLPIEAISKLKLSLIPKKKASEWSWTSL